MTAYHEQLALDLRVHKGLGKPGGTGESLQEWCRRNLHRWRGKKRRAAIAILNLPGWTAMRAADRILRGVAE